MICYRRGKALFEWLFWLPAHRQSLFTHVSLATFGIAHLLFNCIFPRPRHPPLSLRQPSICLIKASCSCKSETTMAALPPAVPTDNSSDPCAFDDRAILLGRIVSDLDS